MMPDTDRGTAASAWRDGLHAVASLTVVPVAGPAPLGRSALYYPLVGLIVGGGWWLLDRGLDRFFPPPPPRAAMVLAGLVAVNGARHARGLACTAAAIAGGRDRRRALARMTTGRVTLGGGSVLLVAWLLQWRSLIALDTLRLPAMLFAPMLACWSIVVLAHGSRAARADGRRVKYAAAVGFREFALASVFTFGVLFSLSQAAGILVGVSLAALSVGLRVLSHWWLDGLTDAAVAAAAEITFTIALVLFAAMQPGT